MAYPHSAGENVQEKSSMERSSPDTNADISLVETAPEKEDSDKSPSFVHYIRILSYGARHWGSLAMALGLLCAMGSGVALPLMNIVFGNQVGTLNQYSTPGSALEEGQFTRTINRNSLYIVYLFIGKFVLTYVSMVTMKLISLRASASLRLEYLESLFSLPISRLDEISSGTVTHAITSLSNQIQQSISDKLAMLFQSLALLVAAYAIAFRYSWALTLVVSAAILFVLLGFSVTVPFFVKTYHRVEEADQKHASIAADVLASVRTVFSLGAEKPLGEKYAAWIEEAKRRGAKLSIISGIHLGILFFAMYVSFGLAFWFGLKLFREGHIDNVNTVITVFFSVILVVTVLGNIASPLMIISKAISAAHPFFSIIDARQPPTTGMKEFDTAKTADITFNNVSFAYPTRPTTQVLRDFNARFEQGKTTALVGPSGSGKSTIVALLERWYDLQTSDGSRDCDILGGEIQVGAVNINGLDLEWWRAQIGLVQQEPVLFNTTIMENISMGLAGTKWENAPEGIKRDMVLTASEEAFADDFIQRLPQGYSTLVGEGGLALSGGQRQRIAIARCIIRRPPILILDEATSSIDVHSERIVQAALERVLKDRTTIFIAHRLSTVRKADHIIVMKDGTNVEEGSHDELMAARGVYSNLVHAQELGNARVFEHRAGEKREEVSYPLPVETADEGPVATTQPEKNGEHIEQGLWKSRKSPKSSTKILLRILREQQKHWVLYTLTLIGAIGASSGFALQSWLFARIVQVFQYTGQRLIDAGNFWALMFFIMALAMSGFYLLVGYCSNRISLNVASKYREEYFHNILAQPISWFDQEENSSGTLTSCLSTDPRQLQELFGVSGIFPLISILSVIGCIAISFSFGAKLAAVAFCAGTPFVFLGAFARIRYEMKYEAINAEVYAESSKFASEAIRAFRTITSLNMEKAILRRYTTLVTQQRRRAMRKAWYATLLFAFADSFELCSMALTFWYGGHLLASHEYDVVSFLVVYVAIVQGGQSAGQFLSFGPNIAQAAASGERILRLRHVAEGTSYLHDETRHMPIKGCNASIQFRDVSFNYSSRDTPIFHHLNLSIGSGQFAALVGASGCGKSTIISLLERFYQVSSGEILMGGTNINSIDLPSYRSSLALVSQEPQLFDGTIRDNLLLGQASPETIPESQIIQACRDAEIHDFITSLPDGYNTALGANAQAAMSGGQRQRVCIARALVRKPSVLLLDEATSSLDSQSERLVQGALERLAKKRDMTIVTVAHRLATIQKANPIFVLGRDGEGGYTRVVESGSHAQLILKRGAYWEMCRAQALDQSIE
ncbi:P-loop containing nucleoside triphosphate hydrolase protein [Aspergillus pseudodeflectus]|uniref:P-loop containing nucleoside triphosphate hydrolase protein n=1 Tax=Aspergillus pseudodeflectus TaxID=176178 RepID=A0ABR4KG69_9EURO